MPVKKKQGSTSGSSLKSSVSSQATMKSSDATSPLDDKNKSSDSMAPKSKKKKKELNKARKAGGQVWESFKSKLVLRATPQEFKSRSARARVAMPVDKLRKRVAEVCPSSMRVSTEAGVALAAALDYGVSELLEVACKACELKQQRTITPRHIKLGVPQDESLAELFRDVTIPQGGTVPTLHPELAQGYRARKAPRRDVAPAPSRAASVAQARLKKRSRVDTSGMDHKEESSPSASSSQKRPGGHSSPHDATDKDETSPVPSDRVSDKEGRGAPSKTEIKAASSPYDPKDASVDASEKKDPSSPSTPKGPVEEK